MKIELTESPKRFVSDNLNMNMETLYFIFKKNQLDFEAPYQRGYVWTPFQKEELIASIVEWMPINAIYWNEYNESRPYEIVDGKQRLSTVFSFMEDGFTWNGYTYSELPRVYRSLIKSFSVAIYLTRYQTQEETERLYHRLNFYGTPHVQ